MKRMPDRLAAPVRFIRRIALFRVPLYAANASFYLVLSVCDNKVIRCVDANLCAVVYGF